MHNPGSALQIDLPVVLPDAPGEMDACVQRLLDELSNHPGIEQAHIVPGASSQTAQVCLHYDPTKLSLGRVRELVQSTGARITEQYGHFVWKVSGLLHQRQAQRIAARLRALPGVLEAEATMGGLVRVEFDRRNTSDKALQEALGRAGLRINRVVDTDLTTVKEGRSPHNHGAQSEQDHGSDHGHDNEKGAHNHEHGGILGANSELYFALFCGLCLGAGFLLEKLTSAPTWVSLSLYVAAYGFGGFYTLREAIENLRLRRFEIDTLMLVAAAGAAGLGEWAEGALLLFLFSIGHALESFAMGRARRAIEALANLAPQKAEVVRDGQVLEIPVEELVVGDTVVARPNNRIPADGFVLKGRSSVNQAPITGESVPVDKEPIAERDRAVERPDSVPPQHRVFAGTINGTGALEIYVTRTSSDNTLARVVKMVSEAETQKSPTQRLTDRFERVFVPIVLLFVGLLLFAWVVVDEPFRDSFYRAMAVLVAASPCALAIATPSAVLSGVARAARGGVLVKGGAPLENLGALTAIAFDKTGTITEGKPQVTDAVAAHGVDIKELIKVAAAVERQSDHPLAEAVVKDAEKRLGGLADLPIASGVTGITGRGVSAMIGAEQVHIGKKDLFLQSLQVAIPGEIKNIVQSLELQGRTTMIVRKGERYLGVIGLMDKPRDAARTVIQQLRSLGINRMIMLSGDNNLVAEAVSTEVGLNEAFGNLMPEDKVATIKKLRAEQKVAMVGDGVNDAPALATADVGIAMGAAGSDVALETADVALMADDLTKLPFAVGLSRSTRRVIRQNLWVSLGMVAILIPATVFGLQIGMAVLLHEGSTLIVVANALRLLAYAGGERG